MSFPWWENGSDKICDVSFIGALFFPHVVKYELLRFCIANTEWINNNVVSILCVIRIFDIYGLYLAAIMFSDRQPVWAAIDLFAYLVSIENL